MPRGLAAYDIGVAVAIVDVAEPVNMAIAHKRLTKL